MLLEYITEEFLLIIFFTIAFISILVSLFYYLRVLHEKNSTEFLNNIFHYYGKAGLRNTFDHKRKVYKKVNNVCIIIFWLSLLMILIVKFR